MHDASFYPYASFGDQPQSFWICFVLCYEHACAQTVRRIALDHRDCPLQDNRAGVVLFIDQVNRAAANFRPIIQNGLMDMMAIHPASSK